MGKRRKDRVTEYAKKVVAGKVIAGKSVIQACQRHLDDLKRSKTKDFKFKWDLERSEEALDLYNELTILEGDEAVTLKTRGFQDFILGSLEGWREKRTNYVRFREAYIQLARQNGKTFISGAKAVKDSNFSTYKQGRIICAATKSDQARLVWDEVKKFIIADSDLNRLFNIVESRSLITAGATGTNIIAIGRDTKSMDGFRSILSIPDELHAHRTNQTYKLLLGGQRKVNNALLLAITTAGFDLNSFCYEHYQFCKKVLSGAVEKDSLFIYIAEMDEDDDIWDYHNWVKSNPLLLLNEDDSINMHEVYKMSETALEAKEKGGNDLLDFMTKWLNMWVSYKDGRYLDVEKLNECASDLTIEDMVGRECILGIDLSSGGDLTSICLLFPLNNEGENESVFIHSHSFMPELRLMEHERTDDVPYRLWVNDGLLTLTTGAFAIKTDYKFIINYLNDLIDKYQIRITAVGYDHHNASAFLSDLEFLGCDLIDITQSARSLNDATVDFKLSIDAKVVKYNKDNKLFKWSAVNATTTRNSFGEIKIDKALDEDRIDPIDSVIDAWKVYLEEKQQEDIVYVPS